MTNLIVTLQPFPNKTRKEYLILIKDNYGALRTTGKGRLASLRAAIAYAREGTLVLRQHAIKFTRLPGIRPGVREISE